MNGLSVTCSDFQNPGIAGNASLRRRDWKFDAAYVCGVLLE